MASACVNNVGVTPGKFSSYGWLSPRASFSRDDEAKSAKGKATAAAAAERKNVMEKADLEKEVKDVADFEFRLDDPVAMLPADELISDGKLMPMMHVSTVEKQPVAAAWEVRSPETVRTRRITEVLSGSVDPCLFSPKAPRCASRWKEIFGLKKLQQNSVVNEVKIGSSSFASSNKSMKNFLHRKSKSSSSSSSDAGGLSLPLLRDSECESLSMSSRLSLSSSSSGHEVEDFPRLSLDSEKLNIKPISLLKCVANSNPSNPNPPPRVRLVKLRVSETAGPRTVKSPMRRTATEQSNAVASFGISIDSPRMNPSGKIVFHSLERSSSSPSSFNGGPRFKPSGMERSYSANVRVAPVLNVPVCSLSKSGSVLGFGQLFSSQQKRDSNGGSGRSYQIINKNNTRRSRTDRS